MKFLIYGILALVIFSLFNFLMKKKQPFDNDTGSDFFAERKRKNQEFINEVASMPSIKIRGIVSAADVGGVGNSSGWKLVFHFTGWETETIPFEKSELRVEMSISRDETSSYKEMFSAFDVIEIEGKLGKHPDGHSQVLMTKFLGKLKDNQLLNDYSVHLQKPVIIDDSILGQLTLDRRINVFDSKINWLGDTIDFSFSCDENGTINKLLPKSYEILNSASNWDANAKEFSAKKLLELKNDTWLGDDETEFSEAQFIGKMKLSAISFETDGSFIFWFDDGDLFWGHTISVTVDENGKFEDAEIMG